MPKIIIDTTSLKKISSLPKIDTTILYTTLFQKNHETTTPKVIKTYSDNESTILNISTSTIKEESENMILLNSPIQILCEENKINYNGKCICDINKGYYSINYPSSNNKCYKKNELPNNIYFNNKTQIYELCYKTCETCIKGGNYLENNCLTCASDYIKEPENNSSKCVEECKYLYYYDSLSQYSCTENEQCPIEASLIVRIKNKCVNKCSHDETNKFQFNGECYYSCPFNTKANDNNICQINDLNSCSTSDYSLNLEKTINQDNVLLTVKNYVNEFYYTINHISRFLSQNYTMILYKNSSCVNELNLNITTIDYESCIKQIKIDNNIDKNKEIVIAIIDIINGDNPITSFGFFDPDTGKKLDASKSCSDKKVIMYENILNILNDPTSLQLLKEQQINIFDSNDIFYTDICFHFDSPNGKDATLQDRIKTFFPNVTLCDGGCKNKGINLTTMKAECECTFQDLLSNDLFQNDLIGDNVLVKEALEEIAEIMSNLNIEVLLCYKDIFNFYYFKKNIGGFIIITLIIIQTLCFIYYYQISYNKLLRNINDLMKISIKHINLSKSSTESKKNPPKKKEINFDKKKNKFYNKITNNKNKSDKIKIKKNDKKEKNVTHSIDKNIIKINNMENKIGKKCKTIYSNKKNKKNNIKDILIFKNQKKKEKEHNSKKNNKRGVNNISNSPKNSMNSLIENNKSLFNLKNLKKNIYIFKKIKKINSFKVNSKIKNNKSLNKVESDIKQFLEPCYEGMDFDDIVEDDKRTFCQYYREKIKNNQIIINTFFISDLLEPRSIKIAFFVLNIDLYFLINGLFYSDSYISEIFNSTEEESFFSFVPRSLGRFFYCTLVGNIIGYIVEFFFNEEFQLKKILYKTQKNSLILKYGIIQIYKSVVNKIKIFIIFNYIIILFSWYYISCLNNVYPNIKNEWIKSSLFIIIIVQILPFIISLLETYIRYLSIKYESEKLFKLSLFFP